eukprot:sb/3478529/
MIPDDRLFGARGAYINFCCLFSSHIYFSYLFRVRDVTKYSPFRVVIEGSREYPNRSCQYRPALFPGKAARKTCQANALTTVLTRSGSGQCSDRGKQILIG